jgi:hypothetical protein
MKAVLHYTRQFAQIVPLPNDQPPPETMEGLGGMKFKRIDSAVANERWVLSQHYHYSPEGASNDADKGELTLP